MLLTATVVTPMVAVALNAAESTDTELLKDRGSVDSLAIEVKATSVLEHQHQHQFQIKARVIAKEDVGLKAQVSGYLVDKHFQEGELVTQGQLLFSLDDTRYQAKLSHAKSLLASAEANLHVAKLDYKRGLSLLPQASISKAEVDRLLAEQLLALAEVKSAKSQIKLAQAELGFTQIRAPFSGKISNSKSALGELVSPTSPALADLVSVSPMDVSFQVSETRFWQARNKIKAANADLPLVSLQFITGDHFSETGKISYIGNRVDRASGTVAVRAEFDNKQGKLLPGQYVELTVTDSQSEPVLLIPQRALQQDLSGFYIFVIGANDTVERRDIVVSEQVKSHIIVNSGVALGERVITHGLQKVTVGTKVKESLADSYLPLITVASK